MTTDPWPRITAALASAAWALPATPPGERPTLPPGALLAAASELPPILLALASGRAHNLTATQREAHIADAVARLAHVWHLYCCPTALPASNRHIPRFTHIHITRGAVGAWLAVQDPNGGRAVASVLVEELAVAIGAAIHQHDTTHPSCSAAEALEALANAATLRAQVTP